MSKLKGKKPESVEPGHIKGLLFGKSGAGKTWLALNFPTPYFIDTEGGASRKHYTEKLKAAGGVYLGPDDGACDYDTILAEIKTLATEKHQYKTLVIDSITKVFQSAIATEAERLGDKDAFGASKKPAVSATRKLLNWITRLDMNVWMIAHEVAVWQSIGGERKEIDRGPDVWEKVVYDVDLALQIEHPNPSLRIAIVKKSRLIGFPEHTRFTLQEGTNDIGYAEFSTRYGKDYIEASAKPIVLANKDQIEEINKLLDVLKTDKKEIKKILDRAKAETVAELTTDQANSFVEWLRKKIK